MVFARTGASPYTTRKPIGGGGTPTQTAGASPAIDAMRQTGTMATARGGAATTAPGASTPAPAAAQPTQVPNIPVQQVDTARMDDAYGQQDATYQQMLADQQKMWGDTQHMIQQNFSGQMRRNASNAARMGLSLGGASYLSGQRSALNQAGNYARQANMDSLGQRIGIMGQQAGAYGQRAGAYGQVAGQNTGATNAANMAQWQEERAIDRDKATAQAERNKNLNLEAARKVRDDYGYLFNGNNFGQHRQQFDNLVKEYEATLSTGSDEEIAAAYNKLMAFVTPFQRSTEASRNMSGGSMLDYFNTARGLV